ncbi:superoxide dismutase [Nocardioidaceae bacterium]|nr:superoxide dismutase [Nocardioidaceae bacterium]
MRTARPLTVLGSLAAAAVTAAAVTAAPASAGPPSAPETIALPDGFQPEGIESVGKTAYVGSLADGDIVTVDLRTGTVKPFYEGDGTPTVGLEVQGRYIFGAGNTDGDLIVVDRRTGDLLAEYQLGDPAAGTFTNDVVVLDGAAYVTDSQQAVLYRLPLEGGLPDADEVETLPLTGEWVQGTGFGANGIETTPDGSALLVINSGQAQLYRVDPATGDATEVEGGDGLSNGDGLLLRGTTLYVVQNSDNQVAVLEVASDGTSADQVDTVTDPDFDVPTTVTTWAGDLYLPNAKFGQVTDDYEVVKAER